MQLLKGLGAPGRDGGLAFSPSPHCPRLGHSGGTGESLVCCKQPGSSPGKPGAMSSLSLRAGLPSALPAWDGCGDSTIYPPPHPPGAMGRALCQDHDGPGAKCQQFCPTTPPMSLAPPPASSALMYPPSAQGLAVKGASEMLRLFPRGAPTWASSGIRGAVGV